MWPFLHPSEYLSLRALYSKHVALLHQSSLKLACKARLNWALHGNLNSAFFHRAATSYRRRTFIRNISLADGSCLSDDQAIRQVFHHYYADLWGSQDYAQHHLFGDLALPCLSLELADSLSRPFPMQDISDGLSSMPLGKAPGPDGYHAEFFLKY